MTTSTLEARCDHQYHRCRQPSDRSWQLLPQPNPRTTLRYGHRNVPESFVVPDADPWPKVAWGMELGKEELPRSLAIRDMSFLDTEDDQIAFGTFGEGSGGEG